MAFNPLKLFDMDWLAEQVPSRPLKLAVKAYAGFLKHHGAQFAAAISFQALFSIFPAAILITFIAGSVLRDQDLRNRTVQLVLDNLPLNAEGRTQLERLINSVTSTNTVVGIVGALLLLFGASGVVAALRIGLNQAWSRREIRPYPVGKAIDLAVVITVGVILLVVAGSSIVSEVSTRLDRPPTEWAGEFAPLIDIGGRLTGEILLLGLVWLGVMALYARLPYVHPGFRRTWFAALLTATMLRLMTWLFSIYVSQTSRFTTVYGSLGVIIALLFFVYASAIALLYGNELAAAMARADGWTEPE